MRSELLVLHMTVLTDSLELTKPRQKVIDKSNSLVEDEAKSPGAVNDKQAARQAVVDELENVNKSVSISTKLPTKLMESSKLLEAVRAETASLKKEETRPDPMKAESNKVIAQVCRESKQRL